MTGSLLRLSKFEQGKVFFKWVGAGLPLALGYSVANELALAFTYRLNSYSPGMFFLIGTINGRIAYSFYRFALEKRYGYTRQYASYLARRGVGSLVIYYLLMETIILQLRNKSNEQRPKYRLGKVSIEISKDTRRTDPFYSKK